MSWYFGLYGNLNQNDRDYFDNVGSEALFQVRNEKLLLCSGGLKENLNYHFENDDNTDSGWLIVGFGLLERENDFIFANNDYWSAILTENDFYDEKLNGHFCGVRWSEKEIFLFSDNLGIRDFYYTELNGIIAFSSRPHILSNYRKDCLVKWPVIGSRWLLRNQIDRKSPYSNLSRVSSSGRVIINENGIITNERLWQPKSISPSSVDADIPLKKFFLSECFQNKKIRLALSGGMDSRFLLSIINSNHKNYEVFTLGDPNHPDSIIASKIASALNLKHCQYEVKELNETEIIKHTLDFISYTGATAPASESMQKLYFENLYEPDSIVIDGGFGEIGRRSLFNKLLSFGKKYLMAQDSQRILDLLIYQDRAYYSKDVYKMILEYSKDSLEVLFSEMPDPNYFGAENWMDLYSVRTKLINYTSLEQARVDNYVQNLTPFSEKFYFDYSFTIPLKEKINSKMYKMLIKSDNPLISKFPIVKGDTYVPFSAPDLYNKLYSKVKNKIVKPYIDDFKIMFFKSMKNYFNDLLNSQSVRQSGIYDINYLQQKFNSSFKETVVPNPELDFWLATELLRQKTENILKV
ncbi:MAG: asparagine synthase-related protein [Candidatus Kapabacteria bacterium]|nr:asparagine synthase-related protein [Candidatus Kapabacteria bacterium]